jgi:hypothetical protein
MNGKRIQLWGNDNLSEFAIIFESKVLARTNVKAAYVKLVDELIGGIGMIVIGDIHSRNGSSFIFRTNILVILDRIRQGKKRLMA